LFASNLSLLMKQQLVVAAMFTNHIEAYVSRRLQDYHDLSMLSLCNVCLCFSMYDVCMCLFMCFVAIVITKWLLYVCNPLNRLI
jgi:hypothetical protein